jgi:hypothetical protein
MARDNEEPSDLQPASEGVGPLLQRDYWAVIRACPHSPHELATQVREQFLDFPPEELVVFRYPGENDSPLEVGDELEVVIRMMEPVKVRVIHRNENSLTLGTSEGHPEAGRITFGAYRNDHRDVIFHIRSRARPASSTDYAGFLITGDPMQTNTWTEYIDVLAHRMGDGVVGHIHVEEEHVAPEEDEDSMDSPTFIARGN